MQAECGICSNEFPDLLLQFKAGSALRKDDIWMVVGRNHDRPCLTHNTFYHCFALLARTAAEYDGCAVRFRGFDLGPSRDGWHDDVGRDIQCVGNQSHSLSMVSCIDVSHISNSELASRTAAFQPILTWL